MTWFDIDAARLYLAGRPIEHDGPIDPRFKPTRKVLYKMVKAGLRVAHTGESGRRILFCASWIDEYLVSTAQQPGAAFRPRRAS